MSTINVSEPIQNLEIPKQSLPKKTRSRGIRNVNKTRKAICRLYTGVSGFGGAEDFKNGTYGEMKMEGIEKLLHAFHTIKPIHSYAEGKRTFYDLGSGVGQIVIAVAHLVPKIRSVGIEQVPKRHAAAIAALEKVGVNISSRISFKEGSFLDPAVNFSDLCWCFFSNLCASAELNSQIAEKLVKEAPVGCIVACSSELPFVSGFKLIDKITIEMSWSKSSIVYLFSRVEV